MRSLPRLVPLLLVVATAPVACGGVGSEGATRVFTSPDGKFRAEFPAEPKRDEQSQTAAGIALRIISYTSEKDDGAVTVGYVDFPPQVTAGGARPVLDGVAEGAAGHVDGRLVSERFTTFLGSEASDYVIDVKDGKGTATARAFLAGDRLYILQAVEEGKRARSERFDRLVASFTLL